MVLLTVDMFDFAFCKEETMSSTTRLMLRIEASSVRRAASRASEASYRDSDVRVSVVIPLVVVVVVGVFDAAFACFFARLVSGESKRASGSESDRLGSSTPGSGVEVDILRPYIQFATFETRDM